mmetsp:Transcript_17121/g.48703  ORF Transcript_17121/g.48703 Transcript_17121/m.48703 type:complete len:330 (+) Transcript_17121:112-1101(+)
MQWVWEDLSFRGRAFQLAHFEAPGEGERELVPDDLVVRLDRCEAELGACLWHSTNLAALRFLERHRPEGYAGLRVLEIGAGPGACGLALALDGAESTLTDVDGLVPLMELNLVRNGFGSDAPANGPTAARRRRGGRKGRKAGKHQPADSSSDEAPAEGGGQTPAAEGEAAAAKPLSAKQRRAARAEKRAAKDGVDGAAEGDTGIRGRCTAQAAEWGREARQPDLPAGAFDVVVVCDCLYDNEESWSDMHVILERCLAARGELVLASATLRRPFLDSFSARLELAGFHREAQEVSEHAATFVFQREQAPHREGREEDEAALSGDAAPSPQ